MISFFSAEETSAATTCAQANQVCGSDNKTDATATSAKCTTQNAALAACILKSIADGGTP